MYWLLPPQKPDSSMRSDWRCTTVARIIANDILIIIATTTAFDLNTSHPYSREDRSDDAVRYTLRFAEVYQFPHVQYITSWEHMVQLLDAADFPAIHCAMAAFNTRNRGLGSAAQAAACDSRRSC